MLTYLTTNTQVLGIVAWVSGTLTVVGVWVAVIQASRAKTAAVAARDAAQSTIRVIEAREALVEMTAAQGHVKRAKDYLSRGGNGLDAGSIHVDLLRSSLTRVRELVKRDHETMRSVRNLVVRTARVAENLVLLIDLPEADREMTPAIMEITQIGNLLDEIAAYQRYTYDVGERNP